MEIKRVDTIPTLMIRVTTPVSALSKEMATAYGEIAGVMGAKGLEFTGPAYARYHNMDMEALDVEMGFPLATAVEGQGRIQAAELPAGEVAVNLHTGPYDAIGEAYEALTGFVKSQGRDVQEWSYEWYLNSPEDTTPEELQTEIVFPLKD